MAERDPASNWRESWSELCGVKQELDSTVAAAHWLGQKIYRSPIKEREGQPCWNT